MKVNSLNNQFKLLLTIYSVLTWISIYWFSRPGPAASVRIYYEYMKTQPEAYRKRIPVNIPTGYSYFPKELRISPRSYVQLLDFLSQADELCAPSWHKTPNVVFESQHESGGHFAAYERPEALVGDLRKMLGKGGPAFAVVASNNGFKS